MTGWTWKTWDEMRRADSRRTAAFNAAVNAMNAQPDLRAAMATYNRLMMAATRRWKDDCTNAIALSEEDPF